jgi:hypothetical protein
LNNLTLRMELNELKNQINPGSAGRPDYIW